MSNRAKRVVLVIARGLASESIDYYSLFNLKRIQRSGLSGVSGCTIAPATDGSRFASLCTGVTPQRHGIFTDQLLFYRAMTRVEPITRVVTSEGFQVSAFAPAVSGRTKSHVTVLARDLGIQQLTLAGAGANEVVRAAITSLCSQRRGLVVLWLDDCARSGSDWRSPEYAAAAQQTDMAIGLAAAMSVAGSADTAFAVISDFPCSGDEDMPDEVSRIWMAINSKLARPGRIDRFSLTDVAPTVLSLLGVPIPRYHEGRDLTARPRLRDFPSRLDSAIETGLHRI